MVNTLVSPSHQSTSRNTIHTRARNIEKKVREKKPDLIILDIIMPELNGFHVLDLVRQHTSVPVIMLTSDNELDSVKLTLALGADGYLLKPVSTRELLARVRDKLRHAGVEAP